MREALLKIGQEIQEARAHEFIGHPLAAFIRNDFKKEIQDLADEFSPGLQVEASPGKGQWADVPWLALFNPQITTSATSGYYPVYLFTHDRPEIYLSLNQGTTEVQEEFGIKAPDILQQRAAIIRARLSDFPQFSVSHIELGTRRSLPRSYEYGHAVGKKYLIDNLPDEDALQKDLKDLLQAYLLLPFRGDQEFVSNTLDDNEIPIGKTKTILEKKQYVVHRRIERAAGVGKKVKEYHGVICQGCGFNFIARYGSLGEGFIEAHHLRPLKNLNEGQSLLYNIEKDFAVLCSNCHRMIHRMDDPSDLEEFKSKISEIT
jgi:5-methylcytosine-specific restriction protein A